MMKLRTPQRKAAFWFCLLVPHALASDNAVPAPAPRYLQFFPPPTPLNLPDNELPDQSTLDYNINKPYILVEDVNNVILTWDTARDYCVNEVGTYLATVHKYEVDKISQTEQIQEMNALCSTSRRGNCHIGLKFSTANYRFRWGENDNSVFDSEIVNPNTASLIPPDTVLSVTNWGRDGDGDGLGDAATPTSTTVITYDQPCVTLFPPGGEGLLPGYHWVSLQCDLRDPELPASAFLCENPHFDYTGTFAPTVSAAPTGFPSSLPSIEPTESPKPSNVPSESPSEMPTTTDMPSEVPSMAPTQCFPRQFYCQEHDQCCSNKCCGNVCRKPNFKGSCT